MTSQIKKNEATMVIDKNTDFQCLINFILGSKLYKKGTKNDPNSNMKYK